VSHGRSEHGQYWDTQLNDYMEQKQSSNTPDYWAETVCEVLGGITKWKLLPQQKESIKANVRNWVVDIREDETKAIIRQIERVAEDSPTKVMSSEIIAMLRERLPRRH
jgi:hypothetical protein